MQVYALTSHTQNYIRKSPVSTTMHNALHLVKRWEQFVKTTHSRSRWWADSRPDTDRSRWHRRWTATDTLTPTYSEHVSRSNHQTLAINHHHHRRDF